MINAATFATSVSQNALSCDTTTAGSFPEEAFTRIALTGIKPTGSAHIGNYLGMIKPALALMKAFRAFYFVADYHALTTVHAPDELRHQVYAAAATWLALGLDPEQGVLYRQSDVPETFEMAWILACFTPKGLLNRAHVYKSISAENIRVGKSRDDNINAGLYNYPVLMAADILLFGAEVVPVGPDQNQHVEIARDVADAVNSRYGDVFKVPKAQIQHSVRTLPGVDGRKMSKSYRNTIPIFGDPQEIRNQVMRIVTDAKRPEAPKDPDQCNVFAIYRHFAPPAAIQARRHQYLDGGLAYADIKLELFNLLMAEFGERRLHYEALMQNRGTIERVLKSGAEKTRAFARPMLAKVRDKIGIGG